MCVCVSDGVSSLSTFPNPRQMIRNDLCVKLPFFGRYSDLVWFWYFKLPACRHYKSDPNLRVATFQQDSRLNLRVYRWTTTTKGCCDGQHHGMPFWAYRPHIKVHSLRICSFLTTGLASSSPSNATEATWSRQVAPQPLSIHKQSVSV